MSYILAVGIAALDIINTVAHYPGEDEEVRAVSQRVSRGGNAANTAALLAAAGHRCELATVLALEPDGRRIEEDLVSRGVGTQYCERRAAGKAPTSYITIAADRGTRAIVHYRDLPEYSAEAFTEIPVESFDWLHFEGRNVEQTLPMLEQVQARRVDQPISLEVEKERPAIDTLLPWADILLFSKPFCQGRGYTQPSAFLQAMAELAPGTIRFVTWGEQGAYAMDRQGTLMHCPAFESPRVVDTVGAGDTFNAGVIDAMASGRDLREALRRGCQLAGRKVGQLGLDGLFQQDGSA